MKIPSSWTFNNLDVADNFDNHVREQLPWYPMVSDMITHIATSYLQENNTMLDLGCSLGEVSKRLAPVIRDRSIYVKSIDSSKEMIERFSGIGDVSLGFIEDSVKLPLFHVCVLMLSLMFTPFSKRKEILNNLINKCHVGGCIVLVDKFEQYGGYLGSVLSRMSIRNKMSAGVDSCYILEKEMSLCGVQRPTSEGLMIELGFIKWFQVGDFSGYIFEKKECTQ